MQSKSTTTGRPASGHLATSTASGCRPYWSQQNGRPRAAGVITASPDRSFSLDTVVRSVPRRRSCPDAGGRKASRRQAVSGGARTSSAPDRQPRAAAAAGRVAGGQRQADIDRRPSARRKPCNRCSTALPPSASTSKTSSSWRRARPCKPGLQLGALLQRGSAIDSDVQGRRGCSRSQSFFAYRHPVQKVDHLGYSTKPQKTGHGKRGEDAEEEYLRRRCCKGRRRGRRRRRPRGRRRHRRQRGRRLLWLEARRRPRRGTGLRRPRGRGTPRRRREPGCPRSVGDSAGASS